MFSEKYGFQAQKSILIHDVSKNIRARVWNLFYNNEIKAGGLSSIRLQQAINGEVSTDEKIADLLGFVTSSTKKGESAQDKIQKYILFDCEWYELYDFIEKHLSCLPYDKKQKRIRQYNYLLESEKSGYRIILGEVSPITNNEELDAITEAGTTDFASVNEHIKKALLYYSDLQNPDYENSIKESICAVESICCIITGQSGSQSTLGNTLKKLENNNIYIHKAMKNAFSSLYGYTSDESGIRHGGVDFTNAPAEDAKYMLVSCSAFVNYLIEKWCKISNNPED